MLLLEFLVSVLNLFNFSLLFYHILTPFLQNFSSFISIYSNFLYIYLFSQFLLIVCCNVFSMLVSILFINIFFPLLVCLQHFCGITPVCLPTLIKIYTVWLCLIILLFALLIAFVIRFQIFLLSNPVALFPKSMCETEIVYLDLL